MSKVLHNIWDDTWNIIWICLCDDWWVHSIKLNPEWGSFSKKIEVTEQELWMLQNSHCDTQGVLEEILRRTEKIL